MLEKRISLYPVLKPQVESSPVAKAAPGSEAADADRMCFAYKGSTGQGFLKALRDWLVTPKVGWYQAVAVVSRLRSWVGKD